MITFHPISTVLDEEGKKRLGDIVRQLRKNLTQREFANSLGIGQSTLSMWESGKVTPDLENLEKLAEVWGKTPEEFVAYLYGRKILNGSVFDAIDAMSVNELAELQILISRQMATKLKLNKVAEKSNISKV
jgi:transcriptional regulator with XRE-family HTH domain